jgi:hypothetical protein
MWRSFQVLIMDFAATASVGIDLGLPHVNPSVTKRFKLYICSEDKMPQNVTIHLGFEFSLITSSSLGQRT